jgi:hypothetical protein
MRESKLNIRVGDVVLAELTHSNTKVIGEVIKITKRFGTGNIGGKRTEPLLTIKSTGYTVIDKYWRYADGVHQRSLCASYVTEIIKRGNLPQVKNNRFKKNKGRNFCETAKKGILFGPLSEIINTFMGKLDAEITTSLNYKKAKALYLKNAMGLISMDNHGFMTIRSKYFERWFMKNWQKCLHTFAEMDAIENEYDKQYGDDYWKMVEADMDRELREEMGMDKFEEGE